MHYKWEKVCWSFFFFFFFSKYNKKWKIGRQNRCLPTSQPAWLLQHTVVHLFVCLFVVFLMKMQKTTKNFKFIKLHLWQTTHTVISFERFGICLWFSKIGIFFFLTMSLCFSPLYYMCIWVFRTQMTIIFIFIFIPQNHQS